ncbi:MAG: TonB-dependent receptor, partial [Balneolaceae bacterium]
MKDTDLSQLLTTLLLFLFLATGLRAQDHQTTSADSLNIHDKLIMERITVVGAPVWMNQIPGAATYISHEELEKQNHTDINRVLRRVSGVNIQEEDGYGLRPNIGLRGSGVERSSKITLMEDGVLIAPAPYAAPAAYYIPSMGRMSSLEVRKGSSQIKYGPNTTGGAINMISTPIPYQLGGRAEISAGEHNTRKIYANVGNTHKHFGYLIETLQMRNDGFKNLDTDDNTGFDFKDFMGKLMFRTNPDAPVFQKIELKFGYYDEISNETYLGLTDADYATHPFRRYAASQVDQMDAEHVQYQVRHFAQFSENLDLTTTAYRNEFARNWYKLDKVGGVSISSLLARPEAHPEQMHIVRGGNSLGGALDVKANNREYYSLGVQTVLAYKKNLGELENNFELGVRLHQDEMDRFQWVDNYDIQNSRMLLAQSGTPGTESNRIESASSLAIYLQDQIKFKEWTFTPGVRYESITMSRENFGTNDPQRAGSDLQVQDKSLDVFVPGVGVVYQATPALSFISGIHKGFAPPSPGSSEDARPENSVNYELGMRYAREHLQTEIIGFYNHYSNLLGSDLAAGGGGGTTAQFNAGEVLVRGAEVTFNLDIAKMQDADYSLPLSLNYTLTYGEFRNTFNSDFGAWGEVEKGYELPYLPRNQFNISLGYIRDALSLDLNGYATSKMRTVAGDGSINPDQST